ncbi:MAG: biotin/lipoyl-binding protein, partial [Lachnospiraceae bacterium]|nr:biotin/lipoyl-binding protein [Lachnospiraceae bacterium]
MKEERTNNRKEWVKNVAIVFLSVMLVLTFFSNTIMNYSLPEVATAMIEPGSITAKIRGTGNLTSDDPYIIAIGESRKIASVAVKQGDVVEKDQILFYLEDVQSAELEEAQKALDDMLLNYSSSILQGNMSQESYEKIQNGQVSSNAEYQSRINLAKSKVENANKVVEDLNEQVKRIELTDTTIIDKNAEKKLAEEKLTKLGEVREVARSAWQAKKSELDGYTSSGSSTDVLNSKLSTAVLEEGIKKTAYEEARWKFYDVISGHGYEEEDFETNATNASYMKQLADKAREVDNGGTTASDALKALQTAYNAYIVAKTDRKAIEGNISQVKSEAGNKQQLQNEVAKLEQELANAEANYSSQEQYVKRLNTEISNADINKEKLLANTQAELLTAEKIKEQAQKELEQLLKDIDSELKLGSQSDA